MDNLHDMPESEPEMTDEPTGPEGEEEHGEGQTVLVNKELCPECMPGDKLIVEVVKDMGQEMEVRYVGKEGEGEDMEKPEMAEPAPMGAGGEDLMS